MAADLAQFRSYLKHVRRHLNESQRGMVAAKLANLKDGQTLKAASSIGEAVSQPEAAELLNVGKRSLERAKKVLDNGAPEICEAVMAEDREDTRDAP